MQMQKMYDKITTKDGWILCPHCGRNLIKFFPDTYAKNLHVFCRRCRKESIIDIQIVPEQ